jgi:hypothetical protein
MDALSALLDSHDIYLPDVLNALEVLRLWVMDSGDIAGAARILSARDVVLRLHNDG